MAALSSLPAVSPRMAVLALGNGLYMFSFMIGGRSYFVVIAPTKSVDESKYYRDWYVDNIVER